MLNYYYKDTIDSFLRVSVEEISGTIASANQFDSTRAQNWSWKQQILILKEALKKLKGTVFLEFSVPRMGKRIDALIIINHVVFVIEFKVGESKYLSNYIEQVWDYALDLKNFHQPSHQAILVPIIVATEAPDSSYTELKSQEDNLYEPLKVNKEDFVLALNYVLSNIKPFKLVNNNNYASGVYAPTPTIIEAAVSLYNNHSVEAITRSDAEAINLNRTTNYVSNIIDEAKKYKRKILCLLTGVPGAGKTLAGLKIATSHLDKKKGNTSVYLSGNAPLVAILQEALARDKVKRDQEEGQRTTKSNAKQAVKSFIQIIHHYRDAYLEDKKAPYDHVAIFDEAQRAWNREQTVKFMKQKKNQHNFDFSEPEFLISCLNRHKDWAVVICLVGGGQEINTGEAGISEWLDAIYHRFPKWHVHISPHLSDSEYAAIDSIKKLQKKCKVHYNKDLHLAVSMRSFRAENVSLFVKNLLDINIEKARKALSQIQNKYPILLTRDLNKAKSWLKLKARGSERYGMVVSSQAQRLKPLAIDVKSPVNPVNWFLDGKDDIRSSYFLEDVATEFHVQGLELDWACIVWDGDLRFSKEGWKTFAFKGNNWQNIHSMDRKRYLINAYRVLLTRARQGMIIVVPEGKSEDHTRKSEYYDHTYRYLKSLGIQVI